VPSFEQVVARFPSHAGVLGTHTCPPSTAPVPPMLEPAVPGLPPPELGKPPEPRKPPLPPSVLLASKSVSPPLPLLIACPKFRDFTAHPGNAVQSSVESIPSVTSRCDVMLRRAENALGRTMVVPSRKCERAA
jgi:hypothetical protein